MSNILIFGHRNPDTDTICSSIVLERLNKRLNKNEGEAVRLGDLNKETKFIFDYLGIEPQRKIEKINDGQEVILVDHNDFGQSVENIEHAKIIEVYDHHRIINFCTSEPLLYIGKPYGCTSTILYKEFITNNVLIDKETAILMISAIISDTLLLKSPTCTENDIDAFNELEKIAEIDGHEYGLKMLKAGTDISTYSAEEIINIDAKLGEEKGKKYIVAQVNAADIDDVFSRKEEITFAMEKEISDKKLNFFIFVITDIINTNSRIIVEGEDKLISEKAFDKKLDKDDSMFLEGVVSRKKQIIPKIVESL